MQTMYFVLYFEIISLVLALINPFICSCFFLSMTEIDVWLIKLLISMVLNS